LSNELEKKYQELQQQLLQIGYICSGSVISQQRKCGKPNCGCKEDQQKLHGPYYIWTRKEKGKTITRSLTDKQAEQCMECTSNYRKMQKIMKEMKEISIKIIEGKKYS